MTLPVPDAVDAFAELVTVMDRLRSPGGCPWDAEQTAGSLLPYLVEESYELVEAIESEDRAHIVEELGDVLLQVVFQARVAQEGEDPFDVNDVIRGLIAKLRRRHPHVFDVPGGEGSATVAQVEGSWERLKREEKSDRESVFDGMPAALPALSRAQKVLRKARRTGLSVGAGAADVRAEADGPKGADAREMAEVPAEDIGARLLALVASAEEQGVDAESALRRATAIAEERARAEEAGRAAPSAVSVLASTDPARIVPLAGTFNFRDAGGYPTADGGRIRSGRLFRADALGNLDGSARDMLRDLEVRTVLDLREDLERDAAPDALEGVGAREISIPIFGNQLYPSAAREHNPDEDRSGRTLERLYEAMIEHFGANIARAVAVLAEDDPGPTVVHCSAGKDRTGVVVALALSAVGVADEYVLADFQASETFLSGDFLAALQTNFAKAGIVQNIASTATQSPAYLMRDVLAGIRGEHGSVREFLIANGLSGAQLDRLYRNLVQS